MEMYGFTSNPSILSNAIIMSSISQSSRRQASSLYGVPLLKSQHVHSITASSSDKPILPTEPHCQGGEVHGRRNSWITNTSYGTDIYGSAQMPGHSVDSVLRAYYRRVGLTSNSSTSSGGQEEERSEYNSPAPQDPSSSYFSEPNRYSDPDLFSIPPSPLDLSALHDTWEHVRAYCNNTMTAPSVKSGSHSSLTKISRTDMLHPRNIRIQNDTHNLPQGVALLWNGQQRFADLLIKVTDIQKQIEDDGVWLHGETAITKSGIERRIAALRAVSPTGESEWSAHFWQEYFFKHGNDSPRQLLQKCVERRQLHSQSYKDANGPIETIDENAIQERYPPVIKDSNSRPSVAILDTPWMMSKFEKRGYAYSDILYATRLKGIESDDFLTLIRRLPTIRLYRDVLHLGAWLTVEIKPLKIDGRPEQEEIDYAVRYSTLTASIMLHEELKLCYMASDDPDFFLTPSDLNNHFIAAVGYMAYHFIHCLRGGELGVNVKYESRLLRIFDLSDASDRENFRQTLNKIHVYHIQEIREIELERLRKILVLDPQERENRLESRTHKYIRFSHAQSKNGWGYRVHDDSPRDQKSEHSATHRVTVERTAPALDAGNSPNSTCDLPQEEQADVSAANPLLLDANSKKRSAEDLDSASDSKERRIKFESHREENAAVDKGVGTKVRLEGKKLVCGSTKTVTGKPCKLQIHSDGAGCRIAKHREKL